MGEIVFLGHQEELPKLRQNGADLPAMGGPAPAAKATEIGIVGRLGAIGTAIDRIDLRLVGDLGQHLLKSVDGALRGKQSSSSTITRS